MSHPTSAGAGQSEQAPGASHQCAPSAFEPPPYEPADLDVAAELACGGWHDGVLPIVGNDGMETVIGPLNDLFASAYPGVRFTLCMRGSATAIPALLAGASWFAPMSRDPWAEDRHAFRRARGYDPTPVRLGYTGHGPRCTGRTPPAFYVHTRNPLPGLSMTQLRRMFTTGSPEGDLSTWGQLGLQDEWRDRRIHLYGLRDIKYARDLRDRHFDGLPYAMHYEPLAGREDIIRAVAQDPFGIAAAGWAQASEISRDVRVVPLAPQGGAAFEPPDLSTVAAGGYPLKAWVSLLLDVPPGAPLPPLLREYVRLALSRQGHAIIAARTHREEGYVPLCEKDWSRQAAQLERMRTRP